MRAARADVSLSGVSDPSPDDPRLTTAVREAGALLGIALLDHIIVGHTHSVSPRRAWPKLFTDN